eukprot:353226-Chlamydomonas_euryale.AAC.1
MKGGPKGCEEVAGSDCVACLPRKGAAALHGPGLSCAFPSSAAAAALHGLGLSTFPSCASAATRHGLGLSSTFSSCAIAAALHGLHCSPPSLLVLLQQQGMALDCPPPCLLVLLQQQCMDLTVLHLPLLCYCSSKAWAWTVLQPGVHSLPIRIFHGHSCSETPTTSSGHSQRCENGVSGARVQQQTDLYPVP